jgi:hypothetical protein
MLSRIIAATYRSMAGAFADPMPFAGIRAPALGSARSTDDSQCSRLTVFLAPRSGDPAPVEPRWEGQWQILKLL